MGDTKVGDITVKLPDLIHIPGIHVKMDLFSSGNKIHKWVGNSNVSTLFYLYLFNKYKSHCIVSSKYNGNPLGLFINFDDTADIELRNEQFEQVALQFLKCVEVESPPSVIIIPLGICSSAFSHANVLIYRKNTNTIEHFEPHGGNFEAENFDSSVIGPTIQSFVNIINSNINTNSKGISPIKLLHANQVCPGDGFQKIECRHGLCLETNGYCQAWSLFITEMALKNPNIPSKDLIDNLLVYIKTKEGTDYLRKVIQGYVDLIYDKISRYYSVMVGSPLTPEVLAESGTNSLMKEWVSTIVQVEMELMNNPEISRNQYIHRLRKFKTSVQTKYKKFYNRYNVPGWYNSDEYHLLTRNPSSIHSRTPTLNDPSPDSYNPYFNSPKPPSLPKISKTPKTTRKHKLDATDTDNNELVKPKRKYTRRTPKVDT